MARLALRKLAKLDWSAILDFAESDLLWRVDLVDLATTCDRFRQIIERDKVVFQHPL